MRNALGASPARLILQFTTEALILVAAGSVFGLTLAAWGMRLLTTLLSPDMISRMPYLHAIGLNVRVVGFACAVSLIAAVVFTLTPVVRVSISERLAGLKEGSRGSAGTTWRRLGSYLVVAELAIAAILLVSAGLLGKSLYRLLHVDAVDAWMLDGGGGNREIDRRRQTRQDGTQEGEAQQGQWPQPETGRQDIWCWKDHYGERCVARECCNGLSAADRVE